MEIPGLRGVLHEIPSVVVVWIFSGTTQYIAGGTKGTPRVKTQANNDHKFGKMRMDCLNIYCSSLL